jgi:hypothetical protein
MNITREGQDSTSKRWAGWHIITVAEAGFSMLDIYGRHQNGLDIEIIRQFADRVNEQDKVGSLYPKAPISAIPRRFFREQENSLDPTVLNDFKRLLTEFLGTNQRNICARRILVDFHVCPSPVPHRYVDATEEVFLHHEQDESIQDIVIFI